MPISTNKPGLISDSVRNKYVLDLGPKPKLCTGPTVCTYILLKTDFFGINVNAAE
jgi:hypothetical protein